MKKLVTLILIFIMTFYSTTFAAYKVNYSSDIIQYKGFYNRSSYYEDSFHDDYYGYFNGTTYYDLYDNPIYNYNTLETSTLNEPYAYCEVLWLKPRYSAITKKDLLCTLYCLIALEYDDFPYPLGDCSKFEDFSNYPEYKRLIETLCATDQYGNCILSGTEQDGKLYLDLDSYVTKAQMSKILSCYSTMYGPFFTRPNSNNITTWNDISNHWSEPYIQNLSALDWYIDCDQINFYPDEYCTIDTFITMLHHVVDIEIRFDMVNTFVNLAHLSDLFKVTKYRVYMTQK